MHLWMHSDIGDFRIEVDEAHCFGAFPVLEVAGLTGMVFLTFTAKFGTHRLAPQARHRGKNMACTSTLKFYRPVHEDGLSGGVV